MPIGGKATPLSPGFIGQVVAGVRFALTGQAPQDWFGPGVPLAPVAPPEVGGRRFDYPTSTNLTYLPKTEANSQGVTFDQLRNLADSLDILRLVIETRKDQVAKMKWVIKVRQDDGPKLKPGEKKPVDPDVQAMTEFFAFPDGHNDFHSWVRRLLEDLFVIDAPTLYVKRTKGGKPMAFEPIDGATIKRLLDEGGRTPEPPNPAYQQILKGLPAVDLTQEDLIYAPRNPRSHMIYGYGPVEQIITTINIGIRRMLGQLAYFTDGSVPDAIAETPENWTAEQIEQFQDYWDSILSGNDQQKRHLRFVPGGAKFQALKPELLKDIFDEWIARIVCYAFSVSYQPFASSVNRATAQTAQQASLNEGLAPVLIWIKNLIDRILRQYLGKPNLEFAWDEEEATDPLIEAQIDQILANSGILTIDEIRDKRGYDPLPEKTVETPAMPLAAPFAPADAAPPHPGLATVSPQPAAVPGGDSKTAEKLAKAAKAPRPQEKAIRTAVKKWMRPLVGKVAAQVTAQMGKVAKADGDADHILDGLEINTGSLAKALKPIVQSVWQDGAEEAASALPQDRVPEAMLEVVNEAGVTWAEEHTADLVTNIADSTKAFIREAVVQTLNEGLSTAELAELLTDGYAFSDARAETIARTESAHSLVAGTMETWSQSGVVDHAEFDASPDCCDECEAEDGKEIPFGTDPSEFMHPNCRCGVTAILTPEDES